MCGLVSYFGDPYQKQKDAFQLILQFNELRGHHSTGLGVIKNTWAVDMRKSLEPAYDFIRNPRNTNIMGYSDRGWIGHCRHATRGAVSRLNAHPFIVEDTILGVHNGTIRNVSELPHNKDFGTDSECLYNMIYDEGLQDALSQADGAWALIYVDTTTKTFNVIRNKDRTLFTARQKDNKGVWFASEAWMLSVALSRCGIDFEKIESVPEDTLLQFDDWNHKDGVPEPVITEGIKGKEWVFQTPTTSHGWTGRSDPLEKPAYPWSSTYIKGWEWHNESKGWIDPERKESGLAIAEARLESQKTATAKQTANKDTPLLTVVPKDTVLGYKKEQLTKQQWEHIKKKGCMWCDDEIEHRQDCMFLSPTQLVCNDCVRDAHEQIPSKELREEGDYIIQDMIATAYFGDDSVEQLKKALYL